jgi:hypothetical protein
LGTGLLETTESAIVPSFRFAVMMDSLGRYDRKENQRHQKGQTG